MAVAPAAAAEGSVAALFAVGLLGLLAWAILRGLLASYTHSIGYLLVRLAGVLRIDVRFIHVDLGGPVRGLDNAIRHTLSAGASSAEALAGRLFHGAALIQEWTLREISGLAHEVLEVGGWLANVHLPRLAKAALLATFPPALIAKLIVDAVKKYGVRVEHVTRTIIHRAGAVSIPTVTIPYVGQWQWIHRHWKALTALVAAAGALVGGLHLPHVTIFPRLGQLERAIARIHRRLKRLEALLGATGLAIALARMFGLPNWRCLTRGNVGRSVRAICGLDAGLLGALLAGLGLLAVPLSIEQLGREFLALEEELIGVVTGAISELDGIG